MWQSVIGKEKILNQLINKQSVMSKLLNNLLS